MNLNRERTEFGSPDLSHSANLHQALTDAVADPLIVVDHRHHIVLFNRAAEDVFGYTCSEVLGKNLNVLIPEQHRVEHPHRVDDFIERGVGQLRPASVRAPVTGRRRDGSEFPAEVSLSSLEFDGERLIAASLRDTTARLEMERALATNERLFRAAFEESPVSMFVFRKGKGTVLANRAFAEQTGYTLEEAQVQSLNQLVHPEDLPMLQQAVAPVISGEMTATRCQARIIVPDGSIRTLDVFITSVEDVDQDDRLMLGQSVDITARVETQQQLEKMIESKNELIASISHELRTPLTAMMGFSHLLQNGDSALTPVARKEMIDAIVAESAALANTVDDLIVAARADTADLAIFATELDLNDVVRQVIAGQRDRYHGEISLRGPEVRAWGDVSRVRQILRSLLSNAIKYGGAPIAIELTSTTSTAKLAVLDSGDPIPEDDRNRIFEPYERAFQIDGLAASMGLGLWISRRLAELMNGGLEYRREADCNVFELRLPAKAPR